MPNNFSKLPDHKRVLLDANVLLHAAFVEDSIAHQCINALAANGYSLLVDEVVHKECLNRLVKARAKFQLRYDPVLFFEDELKKFRLFHVPPGDTRIATGVHRHDKHIARAAAEFNTWVITDDLNLQINLIKEDIAAWNSFQAVTAIPPELRPQLSRSSARHPPINAKGREGWIMSWVNPQDWPESEDDNKHTAFDIVGLGRVFYDNAKKSWNAELDRSTLLSCAYTLSTDKQHAVALTFDSSQTPTKISLRCGNPADPVAVSTSHRVNDIYPASPKVEGIAFGHSRTRQDFWNGYLVNFSAGDRYLSNRLWKSLVSISTLLPHPEQNILEGALRVIEEFYSTGPRPVRLAEI